MLALASIDWGELAIYLVVAFVAGFAVGFTGSWWRL
jgi:hypothetical protein